MLNLLAIAGSVALTRHDQWAQDAATERNLQMRLHYLQHVPFEDLANIGLWAANRGHEVRGTRLYRGDAFPDLDSLDLLVILGGPMNVDDYQKYPWLLHERQFIYEAVGRGTSVLGVCLGGQLLARALGAQVVRNPHIEIGWFPVSLTEEGHNSRYFREFPHEFIAFHWHGDTFDIPEGARRLAGSVACSNQAFQYGGNVLGIQFHLEYTNDSIRRMIDQCGAELVDGPHIQGTLCMVDQLDAIHRMQGRLFQVLDQFMNEYDEQQ